MIIEIVDNFYHSKSSHRCQVHIQYCNHIYTIQKYWYRSVNIYYFVRCTHHDLYSVIYADINLMQCILNNNQCRQSNTPHPLHTGHHFLPYSPLNHTGFTAQCLINNWYGLTFDLLYITLTRCTWQNSNVALNPLLLRPNRSPHPKLPLRKIYAP